jgi:hypothetical protein
MNQQLATPKRETREVGAKIVPHERVARTVAERRRVGVCDYWLDEVWRQYVIGPSHGDDYYCDSPALPHEAGVYFLWSEDWGLVYIGMTNSIARRSEQHRKEGRLRFRYVSFLPVEYDLAPYIEKVYIDALAPHGNRKFDWSHWPGHARMVRLVERIWRKALRAPTPQERTTDV